MATYYNTAVTPKGSPEEAANQQLMAKAGALTANPGKRDIPGNLMPDFLAGKLSFEDLQSQIGGSADFNPSIGPKINYGQGNQSLSPAQLGSLAQGKSVQDVSNMIPQNVAANQQVQQENQSQYAKLAQQFKGTPPPNANQGIGAVNSAMSATNPPQNPNVQNFLQNDPTIQTANQNWMNFNNPTNLQAELMTQMQGIIGQQNQLGSLKAEYMNIQNVMGGTEDDLRNEIQKTGGFATDSQVQALAIARNKTLMKKAALLQNQMALQQDAIQNSQQLLNFEKDMAATQFTQQMQMAQFAYQIQKDTKNAALDSLNTVVKTAGYSALLGTPEQNARIEKLYGLPAGGLQQLAAIDQKKQAQSDLKTRLDLENQQLQNEKLRGDIKEQAAKNAPVSSAQKQLESETKISNIDSLLNDPSMVNAVGPTSFNRLSFVSPGMSNFIAGIDQLTSQLTLDKLIEAKKNGATFGALSDGERQVLASAATKINTWRIPGDNGKTLGYATTETDFKNELDTIKRSYAIDYVKTGGNPQMIGLQPLKDNLYSFRNSDGSYETVKIEQ